MMLNLVASQPVGFWTLGDACRTRAPEWTRTRAWVSGMREIATGSLHMPLDAGLEATTGPVCKVHGSNRKVLGRSCSWRVVRAGRWAFESGKSWCM